MRVKLDSIFWAGLSVLLAACGDGGSGPGSDAAAGGSSRTGGIAMTGGRGGAGGTGSGGAVSSGGTRTDAGMGSGGTGSGGSQATGGTTGLDAGTSSGGTGSGGSQTTGGTTGLDAGTSSGGTGGAPDGGPDGARLDLGPSPALDAAAGDAPVGGDSALDAPPSTSTCVGPPSAALANAWVPSGFCAWTWASNLGSPRGIARNANGDILVIERGQGRITLLHDDNGNGVSEGNERVVLATSNGLNHGIAINGGYLYASSSTTVYRWPYSGGRQPLGTAQTVVTGIPSGGHSTRTLAFDGDGNLYVSVGSQGNIDTNTNRAHILRYPASALGNASTWAQGEAFATGLRNEVGLTLDEQGRMWGVENGSDNLSRSDLGGDIHNDNPGEELHLFAEAGRFWGYPYCWSEYSLPTGVGMGRGTQWADPSTMNDGTHSDTWCRNTANVARPALVMQAHSAPLDIEFYTGSAFPAELVGSALVTFHGSWNRSPATGYKVVRIPFGQDGMPSGDPVPFLEYSGAGDTGSGWPHRPVGLEIGIDGRVFITSDDSGVVLAVGYSRS